MVTSFLRELKRRRVLRTASLYVVGSWVALQVVEVLADAGLPPSTLRNLLIILSIGFPIAIVIGWFFDISATGIKRTGRLPANEHLPALEFFDHVLLAGLVFVMVVDAYVLSFPVPDEITTSASIARQRTIAVLNFEDRELADGSDPIGEAFAGELRSSLTRIAGLRVLGPETSRLLLQAGDNAYATAKELFVTALLVGDVLFTNDRLQVSARLVGVPAGNELWSAGVEGPIGNAVSLQEGLLKQIIQAVAPNLDPDPVQGARAESGDCSDVYELYLRGRQLTIESGMSSDARKRGVALLREAVSIDDQCAIAWEALAAATANWTISGFAQAGAAARRALELNDSLPEAWTVLAEIAEEEKRWSDSEEYFLRALYADPTNARANIFYGEALHARGRVKDGLHYALEAYRNEPASWYVNWHVNVAAKGAGDADVALKHALILQQLSDESRLFVWDFLAEAYLIAGDVVHAVEAYRKLEDGIAPWFLDCVRARDDAVAPIGLVDAMNETLQQSKAGDLNDTPENWWFWNLIRCSTWIGETDITMELLVGEDAPTEVLFLNAFTYDAAALRQDQRFRDLVIETGLLDYWREWGWSDYCEADGESFRCD